MVLMLILFVSTAHAETASVYGGRDGYCGSRTANGERVNCSTMTAAHRRLPFGTRVRVCHGKCVTVRINDRGPFVRGRDIDLSPAAARAIGLSGTGHVTVSHCEHRTQSRQTCASRGFANFVGIPRDQKRLMLGQKLQQLGDVPGDPSRPLRG
jgi:rare lipoprotein A